MHQRLKRDPCGIAGPFHPSGHWRSKSIRRASIVSAPDRGSTLTLGIAEFMRDMRVLRAAYRDLPRSNVGYVTALVAVLGALGLVTIVLRR